MSDSSSACSFFRAPYRLLAILFAVAVVIFSFVPLRAASNEKLNDYGKWYRTGQITLNGGDIYDKGDGTTFRFMYPPTAAILLAGLSVFGQVGLICLLLGINTIAWLASILLAVHLVTGSAWRQHPLLYLVPAAVTAPYVYDIFHLGQPNLLLLACMLGAFACLRHKRDWGAGALIALAVGIKAFPILSLPYLIWRRHWKAAVLTVVFLGVFLVLLPAPFRGFQRNLQDLKTWNQGMALRYDETSIAQRPNRGYSLKNQSIFAVANRLLRPVDAGDRRSGTFYANLADLEFRHVNVIIGIVGLSLCLFYVGVLPRAACRSPFTDSIEYAMLLLLILMFSPLSFSYFFVWLLYPLTVATQLVLQAAPGSRERTGWMIWLACCLAVLSLHLPMFKYAQALGCAFWATLMLLLGLGWKLIMSARPPSSHPTEAPPARAA